MLRCGDEDKIIDIQEPRTCKYNLTFETPLACALDGFLGEYTSCSVARSDASKAVCLIGCSKEFFVKAPGGGVLD